MGISVSGLSSSFDWQNLVDQLRQVENSRLQTLSTQQSALKKKLSAWSDFESLLSKLKSSAFALRNTDALNYFSASTTSSSSTVTADSLLSVTASTSAAKGTYQVKVINKAQAEKLSSATFSSKTSALGMEGTFLVNGKAVNVTAGDTLENIRTKINQANTGDGASGVVGSIIQESSNAYRLVLTSEVEGARGIGLVNGSSGDILSSLGFNSAGTTLKNPVVGGASSDRFSSSSSSVEALLGIASHDLSGTVVINGTSVAVDLSDSLSTIKDNLNAAFSAAGNRATARLVSETEGANTYYRLEIEGMTGWTDENNVLQALGFVEGKRENVVGVTGGVANTTDGSTAITSSTRFEDIYGYLNPDPANDSITISGKKHDGTSVSTTFNLFNPDTSSKTVGELLTEIQTAFGNVTASVTADGKIQVVDNEGGSSRLSVDLAASLHGTNPGSLSFGTFTEVGTVRQYVLQEGRDASFTIDGVAMTSSSNTVTSAIPGVTLKLAGESADTTVTLDIDLDYDKIKAQIQSFVDAYNEVVKFIKTQTSYNSETKTTGGVLFGDNQLKAMRTSIQSTLIAEVFGTSNLKALSDIGITTDRSTALSLDTKVLQEKLETNFDDVVRLFARSGSSQNTSLEYFYSTRDTQAGTYAVHIDQAATKASIEGSGIDWGAGYTGSTGDTLTVKDAATGKSITKSFTAGESLGDIVNTLNSLFDNAGIAVSASVNASNQLQLSQDNYGSGKTITLTYEGGTKAALGLSIDSADGTNVAGTIGGVAAQGTGQILKITNTTSAAYGLQIRYTGTSTGDVGDFTFTSGVANQLEKQLYQWMDSVSGSLTIHKNSIQSKIDRYDDRIASTEELIDTKMAMLTKQFQNMESAISKLQSVQSYISSLLG